MLLFFVLRVVDNGCEFICVVFYGMYLIVLICLFSGEVGDKDVMIGYIDFCGI